MGARWVRRSLLRALDGCVTASNDARLALDVHYLRRAAATAEWGHTRAALSAVLRRLLRLAAGARACLDPGAASAPSLGTTPGFARLVAVEVARYAHLARRVARTLERAALRAQRDTPGGRADADVHRRVACLRPQHEREGR